MNPDLQRMIQRMAERSNHQQGIIRRYYEHFDTISIQKLSEIVSEIYLAEANKPVKLWERAKVLLSRVAAEEPRVAEIIAKKDIKGLARLVNELNLGMKDKKSGVRDQRSEVQKSEVGDQQSEVSGQKAEEAAKLAPPAANDPLSVENLKHAMKAFRKRLKLTKLDDESRLGRSSNPMTGGRQSQVAAIMPPREFPQSVWKELVNQKKLKTSDGVFYELAE